MCLMMKYALELLCILAWTSCVLSRFSGPYRFKLISWDECGLPTDAVHFDLKMHAVAKGRSFSGKIKFDVPIDDTLLGAVKIEKWSDSSGWYKDGHITTKMFCDFIQDVAPGYFSTLTNAIQVPQECPIPKGTYEVKDWEIDLSFPRFPSLSYGEYKITVDYMLETKVIGCVKWHFKIEDRGDN